MAQISINNFFNKAVLPPPSQQNGKEGEYSALLENDLIKASTITKEEVDQRTDYGVAELKKLTEIYQDVLAIKKDAIAEEWELFKT
uniref:Uncharacterized protein n=1 Tax=Romanomermis culicivorax TaxID=13658 RepID=A0A915JPE2_ROMCU